VLFVCVFLYVDCVSLSFLYFFFVYAAIEIFSMNKVDYNLLPTTSRVLVEQLVSCMCLYLHNLKRK